MRRVRKEMSNSMKKTDKIYIAGHTGLAGSALFRQLKKEGYTNLLVRTHEELDLIDQKKTIDFLLSEKPEYVFVAAARVGGIMANKTRPASFIYENLQMECNIIEGSYRAGVKKLLFLGSSCIYPRLAPQPIVETSLMDGKIEPTNEAYGVAKIAGVVLCQSYNKQFGTNFISVMPTNLYGINDNFDPENSHVIAALLSKFHDAKVKNLESVTLWGTGAPVREFLYSDDLASACIFLMNNYTSNDTINIGTGQGVTIKDLSEEVSRTVGYRGTIHWDTTKPDGAPKRLLDVSKLNTLGWKYETGLRDGLAKAYAWYEKNL